MKSKSAFPRPASEDRTQGDQSEGNRTVEPQDGMTLREHYAGLAMQGLLAQTDYTETGFPCPNWDMNDTRDVARC